MLFDTISFEVSLAGWWRYKFLQLDWLSPATALKSPLCELETRV